MYAPGSSQGQIENYQKQNEREKAMASSRRGPWSHHRPSGLATLLFIVASIGFLSACWRRATRASGAPSAALHKSTTIYLWGQRGWVDGVQSWNRGVRWHEQF